VRSGGRRLAVLAVVTAVGVAGPGRPAAANPRGGCPLGRICLYGGRDFTGDRRDIDGGSAGGAGLRAGDVGPCTAVDPAVWSAANRSGPRGGTAGFRLRLYRTADCRQPVATAAPNAARGDTAGSRSLTLECVEPGGCGSRPAGAAGPSAFRSGQRWVWGQTNRWEVA
jgi:Peptidase inhibitor family I36